MKRTKDNSGGMDKVKHWLKQIDRILEKRKFPRSKKPLRKIKKTIEETNNVTDAQVRAIKNIQNGKNMITNG